MPHPNPISKPVPHAVAEVLRQRGFRRLDQTYQKDALHFTARGRWYVLAEQAEDPPPSFLSPGNHPPGFWKTIQNGAPPSRVFEIPAWIADEPTEDDDFEEGAATRIGPLLDWALATHQNRLPDGWTKPDRGLVESWIPKGRLTVQHRGHVRKGHLILEEQRWALRIPVVEQLPETLPEPRRRALERLIRDAHHRWAMVRLVVDGSPQSASLAAELDFSGAPHCESLFSTSMDVLRHVVAWLVETADALACPGIRLASLESEAQTQPTVERSAP